MRYGLLLVILLLMGSALMLKAQDFDATATAIVNGATQTAIAEASQPQTQATDDQFQLTATALVRAATLTAEAFTGETAVPITVQAQAQNAAELTATALVEAATAQSSGSFGAGEEPVTEEEANTSAMDGTILIFVALLIGLVLFGAALVYAGRRGRRS